MLKECLEVFEEEWEKSGDRLILDSYIPADGTYLIIGGDGSRKAVVDIKMDKKTKAVDKSSPYFPRICFYDYHSQLISMNKPVDGKKIIHTNNYLSFAVKKDSIVSGKLTEEIIDGYYEVLKNPIEQKYKKSKEASKIYELFEQTEGKVDSEEVDKKKQWIKEHIYELDDVDMGRKDYLKIFFEDEETVYEREGRRYYLPNIYNSNDYNVEIKNVVYGLPDNNLGMNAKKPFLAIKSRKYPASYVLDGERVIVQKKFFDYLMNLVSAGKYHVYVDTEKRRIQGYRSGEAPERMESGYYLRLKKGKKEAEIWAQDNISGYSQELKKRFDFKDIVKAEFENHPGYADKYGGYHNRLEIGGLINEVFFSNWLAGNYTVDAGDISIKNEKLKQNVLLARDAVFDWIYKGSDTGIDRILEEISLNMIKDALLNGHRERALWQMNLRWSFREYFDEEGEKNMPEIITGLRENVKRKVLADITIPLENDEEYFYAVGQLVSFLISLSKSKDKKQSLVNPFMNAKTDEMIKQRILQIYKKFNYNIPHNYKRVKNLLALVEGYVPCGKVNQEMIILGYASDNLIYTKEEK